METVVIQTCNAPESRLVTLLIESASVIPLKCQLMEDE